MTDTDAPDDRIADALLSGSPYDRLRVTRFSYFTQPITQKLLWMAVLLAAVGLVAPIAVTTPAPTRTAILGSEPLSSSPRVVVLGLLAVGVVSASAASLVAVSLRRHQLGAAVTERQARRLLNCEELASLVGLVTGSALVIVTLGLFAVGHGGEALLETFGSQGGGHPFAPSGTSVSVATLATLSLVAAGVVLVARTVLERCVG